MKNWPIALQVYSVRDYAEKDFAATMREVKAMGYDGVELAGTYGMTAVECKKILDEIGLALVSAHVNIDLLEDDGALADYVATGIRYVAIPWLVGPQDSAELAESIARIRNVAQRCKAAGLQLILHGQPALIHLGGIGGLGDDFHHGIAPVMANGIIGLVIFAVGYRISKLQDGALVFPDLILIGQSCFLQLGTDADHIPVILVRCGVGVKECGNFGIGDKGPIV